MASTQDQISAPQKALNSEENALLEQIKKELNNFVPETESKRIEAVVYGTIGNATKRTLELKYIHVYSEHFGSFRPAYVLELGKTTKFVYEGRPPKGSKVGLVYGGNGHQWVLAWSVPLASTQMRNTVYVTDSREGPVNWDEVEDILDGKVAVNNVLPPNAYAEITQGSTAFINAVFCEPR